MLIRESSPDSAQSHPALDVGFQEVVHSVWTVNAEVGERQRFAEGRMDTHKNASLTPKGREMMVRAVVDFGLSKGAAARQFHTTPKTVAKWIERFEAEGVDGLHDRSSWPHSSPSQAGPSAKISLRSRRRLQHLRRPTPPHFRFNASHSPRRGDEHVA